jgi:D-glycero-D-manno-heptose 1,7-bisphosphate phosphatase
MPQLRRCVFMDRDGVINRKPPPGEYIRTWKEFTFIPAAVDWIRLFNALDLLVIVVTNQRGVALGRVAHAELQRIHDRMRAHLGEAGARIDDIFTCPHEKDTCECRKPKPGLVLDAARKWNISISDSLMIGDSASDRALAISCGLRFVPVAEGQIIDDLVLTRAPGELGDR